MKKPPKLKSVIDIEESNWGLGPRKTIKSQENRPLIAFRDVCSCGGKIRMVACDFPGNFEMVCENCSFEDLP